MIWLNFGFFRLGALPPKQILGAAAIADKYVRIRVEDNVMGITIAPAC